MHASLFYVFHDPADQHILTITNGIDIDFFRVVQESVQQDRLVVGNLDGGTHIAL